MYRFLSSLSLSLSRRERQQQRPRERRAERRRVLAAAHEDAAPPKLALPTAQTRRESSSCQPSDAGEESSSSRYDDDFYLRAAPQHLAAMGPSACSGPWLLSASPRCRLPFSLPALPLLAARQRGCLSLMSSYLSLTSTSAVSLCVLHRLSVADCVTLHPPTPKTLHVQRDAAARWGLRCTQSTVPT